MVKFRQLAMTSLLVCGLWQLGSGSYIYAKALLAQHLITDAWAQTLNGYNKGSKQVKPWKWADTWPVARLTSDDHDIDLMVLQGSSGRTLAFGPGHMSNTPLPGALGNSVIGGHRDTHFSFLQHVEIGDTFTIQTPDNRLVHYRVYQQAIVDKHDVEPVLRQDSNMLTLVTCFPFNTLVVGGPLRFVVMAKQVKG